jgi:hypothetical protein
MNGFRFRAALVVIATYALLAVVLPVLVLLTLVVCLLAAARLILFVPMAALRYSLLAGRCIYRAVVFVLQVAFTALGVVLNHPLLPALLPWFLSALVMLGGFFGWFHV